MEVQAIVANVIDRCGGSLIEKLPSSIATFHVLNVMERKGLELASTFKGTFALKIDSFWGTKSDQLSTSAKFINRPQYVRYRRCDVNDNSWQVLDVLNDIEELTHAENNGILAVWFTKSNPFEYHLSFCPPGGIYVEVWGQNFSSTLNNLSSVPKLPEQFSQMIAVEASIFTLDDLLLLPSAGSLVPFFNARKTTLSVEKLIHDKLWTKFLAKDENRNLDSTREPFDIFEQMHGRDCDDIYWG